MNNPLDLEQSFMVSFYFVQSIQYNPKQIFFFYPCKLLIPFTSSLPFPFSRFCLLVCLTLTFFLPLWMRLQSPLFKLAEVITMGSVCSQCFQSFKGKQPQQDHAVKEKEPPETNRSLAKGMPVKEEKNESVFGKGSSISVQSNSSVRGEVKSLRSTCKTLCMPGNEQFKSQQFTLDPQSVIFKEPGQLNNDNLPPEEFYTLIDKMAFVRRTKDCIRILTLEGHSELNCGHKFKISTLSVIEGRPIQTLKEFDNNKIIQSAVSPIKVSLKLRCKACKKQHKLTFCKGVINLGIIECASCEVKGTWTLLDISANAPIWGDGHKIDNHDEMETAPSIMRVMGCVNCMKFSDCKPMRCGCLLCQTCLDENAEFSLEMQCRMCEGSCIL